MIKAKTVFVLGAGANMPFGFPSGAELRKSICGQTIAAKTKLKSVLNRELGIEESDIGEFGLAFDRSLQPSIDAFLSRRDDMSVIGKLCIAYELCNREVPNNLYPGGCDDHWFQELWRTMTDGLDGPKQVGHIPIRFVTFNYDRSLEFLIHEATKHTFGLSDAHAFQAWNPIPLVHVYGSLGMFDPTSGTTGRPFSPDLSGASLRVASNAVRVIPEARHDDEVFKMVRSWFEWAERICFLGFGFDSLNMERLGLGDVLTWLSKNQSGAELPWVVASTFKMTPNEIKRYVTLPLQDAGQLTALPERNLMTLRQSGVLG